MNEKNGIRINKYLSEVGFCSRREADRLIAQGRVRINGQVPVSATPVSSGDKIMVDGRLVESPHDDHIYLAFNKPVGIVSTTDTKGEKDNIIDYINYPRRIFPVGRLDKDSEGLILLTSDGDIVNKILRASNKHEKEYIVTVNKPITEEFIKRMSEGVPILGKVTKKCKVEAEGAMNFKITLTQGLNRQIRRMCEFLGYEVRKLKRVRIMHIELDQPPGQFRDLTEDELDKLKKLVAKSKNTVKAASTPPKKKSAHNKSFSRRKTVAKIPARKKKSRRR